MSSRVNESSSILKHVHKPVKYVVYNKKRGPTGRATFLASNFSSFVGLLWTGSLDHHCGSKNQTRLPFQTDYGNHITQEECCEGCLVGVCHLKLSFSEVSASPHHLDLIETLRVSYSKKLYGNNTVWYSLHDTLLV